jgi:hypothetical protein
MARSTFGGMTSWHRLHGADFTAPTSSKFLIVIIGVENHRNGSFLLISLNRIIILSSNIPHHLRRELDF